MSVNANFVPFSPQALHLELSQGSLVRQGRKVGGYVG
jgi:hypothetical protein